MRCRIGGLRRWLRLLSGPPVVEESTARVGLALGGSRRLAAERPLEARRVYPGLAIAR